MSHRHDMSLCIAAFWVEGNPEDATNSLASAITADVVGHIQGTGSVVTIAERNVDARLRGWLRSVDIAEAADA